VSVLRDLRVRLATDLAPLGVPVFAAWPDTIVLPCVYVLPPLGSIYVAAGPCLGEYTVYIDVAILADHAKAPESLESLEDLLELAIKNSMDWAFNGVEPFAPITVTESGAEYLGTVMHLSKPVHL
jgi:hypothetical protein